MSNPLRLTFTTLLLAASSLSAATHYVSLGSANPTPPYTNWMTAATNIQDAVDAAQAGDTVVVTDGVYAVGQRETFGNWGNSLGFSRVVVTNAIGLFSVNGPQWTVINGGGTNQCVSLTDGASLTGFTLTNGYAYSGAGVWCASTNAFVTNCVMVGNSASYDAGGAYRGTLYNCTLTGNSASNGGGAEECRLYNCTVTGNYGDGAFVCALYNCALTGNSRFGALEGTLQNCTLTGNAGGGASGGTLYNCIAYFNTGANYASSSTLNYCCTTPLPANGVGNIALDPQLASASYLSADSPCRAAGSAAYATGTDIDGEPWANPPSIGCDEYHPGAVTGPLSVSLVVCCRNVAVGHPLALTGLIEGRTTESVWAFGDGNTATNEPYVTHSWTEAGDYLVVLRAFNKSHASGVSATLEVHVLAQPVVYVAATSTNPQPPYTSWATAATDVQAAVDGVTAAGALVLVTNGVYRGGVAVTKALTLLSVNGPQFTVINGGGTNQCVSLTNGASVTGFTVTNGVAHYAYGGGVGCASTNVFLTNCIIVGNWAPTGGGVLGGTLYNCTLTHNSAYYDGGGAFEATLYNCTLSGNSADLGGGACDSTLNNCTVASNSADQAGGGACGGSLTRCTVTDNTSTVDGGGTYDADLTACTVMGNTAGNNGGGACSGTLINCTLTGNSAYTGGGAGNCLYWNCGATILFGCALSGNSAYQWGGAYDATLQNCTLTCNSATAYAGGAGASTLSNCIVYYNTVNGGANLGNYDGCTLNYCCTTPLPTSGTGNIALDPQLASVSHLSASSPCRGAGRGAWGNSTDIDGEAWGVPPSIGCDEYHPGAVIGPLNVNLAIAFTNLAVGYPVGLIADIQGRASASAWDFGDGVVATNQPGLSHAWTASGNYPVVLRAYNESYPTGVTATVIVHVSMHPAHYVAAGNTHPEPPYLSWDTAAATIQEAVDAAAPGAEVFVTNGIYTVGGRATQGTVANRVAVDKPQALRSLNGPQWTLIDGGSVVRCVYLTNGASLSGFTVTNGSGGVYCEASGTVSNCVIIGNSAGGARGGLLYNCTVTRNSVTGPGGGAYGGTLYNCALSDNSGDGAVWCTLYNSALTGNSGVGASWGTLQNCTLTGNSGGGANACTLYNCIVYFNNKANYDSSSTLNYCCTTPRPANGVGNITLNPQLASASHLSASSPCRRAGSKAYATGTDIDGESWGNPPSMGCDEYHTGAVTGPLSVSLVASYTNVGVGYSLALTGLIEGRTTQSVWAFGDGHAATNEPYVTHSWTALGDYLVALRAFNESHAGGVSATVTVHVLALPVIYVAATSTNPQSPYLSWATAATNIQPAVDAAVAGKAWVLVTNGVYGSVVVGKPLTLLSVNGPQFTVIDGRGTNRCVSLTDAASLTGFTLTNRHATSGAGAWCASTNAFLTNCMIVGNSASSDGGGVYSCTLYDCALNGNSASNGSGGGACYCSLYNCTLTGNSAIFGGGADYCALYHCTLTGNDAGIGGGAYRSTLSNCTLSGNSSFDWGGGASDSALTNCTLTGNSGFPSAGASRGPLYNCTVSGNYGDGVSDCWLLYHCTLSGNHGAGARGSTLYNCLVSGNYGDGVGGTFSGFGCTLYNCAVTANSGAGARGSTLYNCTLTGNSGGAATTPGFGPTGAPIPSTLYNCIVYFNTSSGRTNFDSSSLLNYCCTTPLPANGVGNIANAPLFVDYSNGNLRLQSNSPCVNSGTNAYVSTTTDLDGRPRIVGGTVDMGAYECQSPALLDFYNWLQTYALSTSASSVYADADGDGMNNWQEWVCGTDPTNGLSALRLLSPSITSTNVTVSWQSVAGVNYFLERSANLASSFTPLATNLVGQAGTTSYGDTNAAGKGPFFYRVGVRSP